EVGGPGRGGERPLVDLQGAPDRLVGAAARDLDDQVAHLQPPPFEARWPHPAPGGAGTPAAGPVLEVEAAKDADLDGALAGLRRLGLPPLAGEGVDDELL